MEFSDKNKNEIYKTLKELCEIPSPSFHEEKRAEYILNFLKEIGIDSAYIDEVNNVIFPYNIKEDRKFTVISAHTDTVFPDLEPLPYREEDGKIYCPGVGDNTASVTVLLYTVKYLYENNILPQNGIMFVWNTCEEGLGNLRGIKYIFEKYSGSIQRFVAVDANYTSFVNECVGSERIKVSVKTPGGHSFSKFGIPNAINESAKIVNKIYETEVPKIRNSKTTYNVGTISGGTSVNSIPEYAEMMCEYRSDNKKCLDIMREKFKDIFDSANRENVAVNYETVAIRPCSQNVDREEMKKMYLICDGVFSKMFGGHLTEKKASTDCNIPLSLGIPAVNIGCYRGAGAHTRNEYIYKDSILQGLEYLIKVLSELIK